MILDGKKVKLKMLKELKETISEADKNIGLTVIQIGHNPASDIYIKQKRKVSEELGFNFNHIQLDENVTTEEVIDIINKLNNDDLVDGLFLQLPVPKHLDTVAIQNAIDFYKDIDGLTDENIGRLAHNQDCLVACTPQGIMDLLETYNISVDGKNVCIIGRSDLVGKPLSLLMTNKNATVTLCHSHTKDLKTFTNMADILVVAIGKPNYITSDYVKKDAVVIDVGINRTDNGIVGDVDFEDVQEKASLITPVPGGIGQMTTYEVGKNTYKAHILRKGVIK